MFKNNSTALAITATIILLICNLLVGNNALGPNDLPTNILGMIPALLGGITGWFAQIAKNQAMKVAMGLFSVFAFLGATFMTSLNIYLGY